jgi:AAA+ ATPase superfamily predicted ATPase
MFRGELMSFIGRKDELRQLDHLRKKKTASLVCLLGRRRIGKSALIEHWSKGFSSFFEVQGLGPETKSGIKEQLNHFAEELSLKFKVPKPSFSDWDQAFDFLSGLTKKGEWLILLDEISWMATDDPLFGAKLKSAWDMKFKNNTKLVLVLCGSVSIWIENNILKNSNFLGRVSLSLNLKELNIKEISQYFDKNNFHAGSLEKMILLSIAGGVPKYLEEIVSSSPSIQQITKMCFNPSGILYNDFKKIFSEIFNRRSKTLEKIIRLCMVEKLTPQKLANKLKVDYNSDLSEAIHILELAGFLSRDYFFNPKTAKPEKFSFLRVKDNYTRFYLKIIEPLKKQIEKGSVKIDLITDLKAYEAILGYQFENLILANRSMLNEILGIKPQQIRSSAPYMQRKTELTPVSCQIDLLIHTDLDVFYLCEFKCQKLIDKGIIKKVEKKMHALKIPMRSSLKPVLIYEGELYPPHEQQIKEYFYKIISFSELVKCTP